MIKSSEDKTGTTRNLWWIPDENEVWTLASQVSDELPNGCVNFLIQRTQRLVTLPLEKCLPAPSSQLSIPEDLVYIPEVNAASILSCIRTRFVERKIYTNIGMVLMAVNPFEVIPGMYGKQMIEKYENPMVNNLPAHVYVIASRAFHHLCQGQNLNQSILISGESGAGKTEATKQCLSFLAELAQRKSCSTSSSSAITDRILFASPILEAFGNAKTLRNNNSSRFGKWMVLNFDQYNSLHSSNIVSYLLEKSRVTQRDLKERNYHIFYQLLRGVDQQVLQSWNIFPETKHYRFLQTADEFEAIDLEDQKTFHETYTAFLKVGFSHDETMNYLKVVAAILQLGNVIFTSTRDGEACDIKNREYVNFAAEKLGINAQVLSSAMCSRSIESGKGRKSIISINLSAQKAQETRDTLARFIYDKLFHDIIDNINTKNKDESSIASTSRNPPRKHIGLLDIFGFEIFAENSFEQLCINYCNEMLQYHFNFVIFTSEKNLYAKESIFCETIEFRDNIEVIRDIEHLFKTLDEEARIPKGSAKTWYDKLKRNFKSSHITFPTRRSGDIFVVKHYAGDVDYTPLEFMDKNIEVLNNDLLNAMVSSKDPLIFRLFTRITEQHQVAASTSANPSSIGSNRSSISVAAHDGRQGATGPSGSTLANKSISWRFIHQLSSLTAMLKDTQSHFIRCVKSNDVCQPQLFDSTIVFKQLTYSGIFEVVKIQQSGLPCRLTHSNFLTRYRCLTPGKVRFTFHSSKDLLKALQGIGYELNRAKIGTNLTFFSSSEQRLLEKSRDVLLEKSSTLISRFLRMTTRRYAYRFIRQYYRDFQIHNANLDSEPATASYEKFCQSCARMDRLVRYSILERQMRLMKKHLDFLDARVDLIRLASERLSEKTVEAIISLNDVIAKAIDLEITEHPIIVQCRTIIHKYNRTLEFMEIIEQTKSKTQEEEEEEREHMSEGDGDEIESEIGTQKIRPERGKRRMTLNHLTKSQLEECISSLSEFREYIPNASDALQTTLSHQQLVEQEMREVFYPLQESLALAETAYDEQTGDLTLKFGDEGAEAYLRLQRLVKQYEVGDNQKSPNTGNKTVDFKGKDCALLFEDCHNFIRLMEEYVASNEAFEAIQFVKSTSLGRTTNEIFLRQLPQLHLWADVQLLPQILRDDLLSHHMIPKSDIANEISDVTYQQLEDVCQKLQKIHRPSDCLFTAMTVAKHFVILRKAFVEKNWKELEEACDVISNLNIEKNLFDDFPSCYDELHHAHWQISYHNFLNDLLYSISEPIIQSISFNMDLSAWIVLVADLPEDLTLIQEIKSFANSQTSSKLLSLLPLFESILQLRSLLYSREIPFVKKILAALREEHSLVISEFELTEKLHLELQHCEKLVLRLELEEKLESWLQKLAFIFSFNAINVNLDALQEIEAVLGELSSLSSQYHADFSRKIRFCEVLVSGLRKLTVSKQDKHHWSNALLAYEEEIFRMQEEANAVSLDTYDVVIFDLATLSTSTSVAELFLCNGGNVSKTSEPPRKEDDQSIIEKDRDFFILISMYYQIVQFELFRRYLFYSIQLLFATEGVITGNVQIDLSVNTALHGDSIFQLNELTRRIHQICKYTSVDTSFSYAGYGLLHQLKFPTILCISMPDHLQYLLHLLHRHYSLRQLIHDNLWEIPHPDPLFDTSLVNPDITSLLLEVSFLLSQGSGFALSEVNLTILTREVEKIALELKSRMVMKALRHELENIKIENVASATSSMRKISISLGSLKAVMKTMDEFPGPKSKRLLLVSNKLIRLIDLLLSNQIDKIHQKDLDEVIEEFQLLELNPDQIHQIFHQVQIHNFLHELNEILMLFKSHHHDLHLLLKSIHQLHKNLLKILHARQIGAQTKNHSSQHHHYHHWKCLLWLKASYFYCNLSSVLMHYSKPAMAGTSSSPSRSEYNWIQIIESCNQLDEFIQIYLMPLFYEIIRSKIKHLPHQSSAQTTLSAGVRRRDSIGGHKSEKQESRSTETLNDDSAPSTLDYTEDVVKFMELCIHLTQEGYQFALRIKLHLDAKEKQASLSALSPLENLKKEIRDFDLTTNPYSFGHLKLAGFSNQQIVQSLGTRKALTSSSTARQVIFDAKLLWAYNVDLHLIKKFASSTYSSRDLLLGGYSLKELYNCGYTPAELFASELVSIQDLLNIGLSITQLRESGIYDEIILREITDLTTNSTSSISSSMLHKELKGFSLSKLLSLGYKLPDLRYFNFSLLELRAAGFTALEIHRFYQEQSTSSSPPGLPDYVKAGFSLKSLLSVFSLAEFRRCQYSFEDLRKIGVDNDEELFSAGYVKELEYEALSLLYQSCHGAFWKLKTNWNDYEVPLNQWFGISTTYDAVTETERVYAIELINNNLRGFLPSELSNLKKLQKLRLSLNNISNDLPPRLKTFLLQNQVVTDFMRTISTVSSISSPPPSSTTAGTLLSTVGSPVLRSPPPPAQTNSVQDNDNVKQEDEEVRSCLRELFHALGGRKWKRKDNWCSDETLDRWFGVKVDQKGRIIELNLASNNLQGSIPSSICSIRRLKVLDFRLNQIGGFVPPSLSECRFLERIHLQSNKLCGHLPESLQDLSRLRILDLRSNLFNGISAHIFQSMKDLQYLGLHSNKFLEADLDEVSVILPVTCKLVR